MMNDQVAVVVTAVTVQLAGTERSRIGVRVPADTGKPKLTKGLPTVAGLLLCCLVVSGCGRGKPTYTPTPTKTPLPINSPTAAVTPVVTPTVATASSRGAQPMAADFNATLWLPAADVALLQKCPSL